MLNVATSKEKNRLVIIGNFEEAKKCKAYVASLADYYEKLGNKNFKS